MQTHANTCDSQVRVGFSPQGTWKPPGHAYSLRNDVTAVAKSLSFLKVAGALYQVLELACRDYTKSAVAFSNRMSLFDLHLGTELQSVFLMRELFRNRKMLLSLREEDVVRYTHMLASHRKAAFALLLRSVDGTRVHAHITCV
jgi:hypothetical protein